MKAALCLIGTELTRGIIQDGHTKLIASNLESLGYEVSQVIILPDDGTIREVLNGLAARNDVIITTGGLGPTSDDITRDVIAQAAGVKLYEDQAALKTLEELIRRPAGPANRRQVMIPEGFSVIPNPQGTAPGFTGFIGSSRVFCLPGPPHEMEWMLLHEVLPELSGDRDGYMAPLEAITFLIPESQLEELCRQAAGDDHIHWGTRVQSLHISLYLSGASREVLEGMIARLQNLAGASRVRLGSDTLARRCIDQFRAQGVNVALAESCTGGMISKILTDEPGSSEILWGSFVTYANEAKTGMLKVQRETLAAHGAVSEEVVREMAEGALTCSGADAAVAVTGVAGPSGGSEEKPVGTLWFGLASTRRESVAVKWTWGYPRRDLIRRRSAVMALLLLEGYVKGEQVLDMVAHWQYS